MKLVIFDLDDVLIHEGFEIPVLCNDTLEILDYLKSKNIKISLASHNMGGIEILKTLNIYSYFEPELCVSFFDNTKHTHLTNIITKSGLKIEDMIFFDDLQHNINCGRSLGIKSILVDFKTGITMKRIRDYF